MAAAEQPLKKRRLYDPPPSSPPPPPSQPHEPPQRPPTPPPLSHDEIARRRRNQEGIRNVFECYKKIKLCIDRKDKHLTPELEEAYHSLITSAGGCASVQRLVAEYIPRYASFFPAALEAAGKALINMHNQCITVISGGEDIDGIAFETTKACILGLVDVCRAAASENRNSEVIQRICSVVFHDVVTFFVSSFDGKSVFDVVDQSVLKIYDVAEALSDFKRKLLEEHSSVLLKLSKLRGLCFLSILFHFPKYSLVAFFKLFESTEIEGIQKGKYLLHQLTDELDYVGSRHLDKNVGEESFEHSSRIKHQETDPVNESPASIGNSLPNPASPLLKNCLLALVLRKDPSLRSLIFSRYRMLCNSASSEIVSDITSGLEGVFESFVQQVKAEDSQVDNVEGNSNSSKSVNQCSVARTSNQQGSPVVSGRDYPDKHSGSHLKRGSITVNAGSDSFPGELKSMDHNYGDSGDMASGRMFMQRELLNRQSFSPRARTPRDLRSSSFSNRSHSAQIERSPISNMDLSAPTLRSSSGAANSPFESPKQNVPPPHSSGNHAIWYSDGDPAAMDIFPASKQLWLGSLGHDVSEMHIRFQFEKFGVIDHLRFFPFKGFATIEYRNLMDALKAREVMRGRSPWGACLRIKFLDAGLGARGFINGTAVGSSCHVYVGSVPSIWAKDEMVHEVKKLLHKGPRMVIDLSNEGALLMEFDSPEEATVSIAHLRRHRKENSNYYPHPSNTGPPNVMMHAEAAKPGPPFHHTDTRNAFPSNSMIGSPHTQPMLEKPPESYLTRTSALPSFLQQLRAKYNISNSQGPFENHATAALMREQERVPTNMLWINFPNKNSPCITEDELLEVCNLAINNNGSVRVSRPSMPSGSNWLVECSSTDTANTLFKNLRECPGIFFQINFSNPAMHHGPAPSVRPDLELTSPRMSQENCGPPMQPAFAFQSTWTTGGMMEVGRTGAAEQSWMYGRPESGMHSGGSITTGQNYGPPIPPPQPAQTSSFNRPVYPPPNGLWDARGMGHHLHQNPIHSAAMHANSHANVQGPPFLPASVTPLAQIRGSSAAPFDQMFSVPVVPPPLSSLPPLPPPPIMPPTLPPQSDFRPPLPPHPELQPPLPPAPPPLPPPPPPPHSQPSAFPPPPPPHSQPPAFPPPPPPNSPPPPSLAANPDSFRLSSLNPWQGMLSKSGVYYCTIHAQRADSDICSYSNSVMEPAEWPAKLDMTKRTDLRHVKSTFSSTPRHRKEICWLLPSSHGDHKGLHDFISYLKQRECAGVIKLPASKTMWARLLFILPYSPETCSFLSIPPNPSLCLIGLILPKDANSELS
ncbi:uncharacterized protein LOC121761945 isoform X1 [Salvia splendens]|uniref:uncharacterized protein LOC121761945 isoform X1 n=1 Tax=Salvia splendens TaxID=180675 RepID=UPI001C2806B7|nr:uncharacterized protein LOC121761945 isoform X1 [Salvia splendens]